jgi:hypothetical protein
MSIQQAVWLFDYFVVFLVVASRNRIINSAPQSSVWTANAKNKSAAKDEISCVYVVRGLKKICL